MLGRRSTLGFHARGMMPLWRQFLIHSFTAFCGLLRLTAIGSLIAPSASQITLTECSCICRSLLPGSLLPLRPLVVYGQLFDIIFQSMPHHHDFVHAHDSTPVLDWCGGGGTVS